MVIDDDEDMRHLLAEILRPFEFTVIPAETSEEGLNIALSHPPDVVLCDVMLPDAMGFETAQALNQHPVTSHVPVVLMTGYAYMRKHAGPGHSEVLLKPFQINDVITAIEDAMRKAPARVAA